MQIRRFQGADMRDAMRQVRDALGPEAVILETTRTTGGVEIAAAIDHNIDQVSGDVGSDVIRDVIHDSAANTDPAATDGGDGEAAGPCVVVGTDTAGSVSWQPPRAGGTAAELDLMREEMRCIRSLLETQVSRLLWDEHTRQTADTAGLLRHFTQLSMEPDVARALALHAARLDAGGWVAVLRTLVERLPVSPRDVVADGGVYAVVGPTGVGKTTTIAKLAARAALRDGPASVGLVTTDTFRVAAREQLETFGQILGIPVAQAGDAQSLRERLAELRDRRLVLIDTAGMGQRDPRLPEQLARLAAGAPGAEPLLALPASAHTGVLQEIADVFRSPAPVACILTKTDEATSLGGAFSVLIRTGLQVAYVANGQRVPEDLHLLRNRETWLAKMAIELMRRENRTPDADTLARRYTEVGIHAAA